MHVAMAVGAVPPPEGESASGDGPWNTLLERLKPLVPDRLVPLHATYVLVEPIGVAPALPPWFFGRLALACISAKRTDPQA